MSVLDDVLEREPTLELDGYPPVFVPAAYAWHPPRVGSWGGEVVAFAELIGHPSDVEQAADLDVLASYGPGGVYVAGEAWELEGRQNGKTDRVILPWTLWDFFVGTARIVHWTSHLMSTTLKTKRIVDGLIERNPLLSSRVAEVVDARGSEAIVLKRRPGEDEPRLWLWESRSTGAGRGGPCDVWVADEGLFLTQRMLGDRRPTLRSRPNTQVRGASSAALAASSYLRSVVKRGRAGGDRGLAYVERCAPGDLDGSECESGELCTHVHGEAQGCALDREDRWHLANHGLARGRISYRKMRDERSSLNAVEFAREGCGWHEPGDDDVETVSVEAWDELADRSSRVADGARPDAFVVGVLPDQTGSVVAVAGRRDDGLLHVALIRSGPSSQTGDALVEEVVALRRKHRPRRLLVLGGPAGRTLATKLKQRRVRHELVGAPDAAAAASDLRAGVRAEDFRHRGDRIVRASLEAAAARLQSDGGWAFDTREGGEVLPILAVTVARWAAAARRAPGGQAGRSYG